MRKILIILMLIAFFVASCSTWEGIGTIEDKLGRISSKMIWKNNKVYFIRAYEEYSDFNRVYYRTRYVVNEFNPYAGTLYIETTDKLTWDEVSGRGFLSESEDYLLFNYSETNSGNSYLKYDVLSRAIHLIEDSSIVNKKMLCISPDSDYVYKTDSTMEYYNRTEDTTYTFEMYEIEDIAVNWNINTAALINASDLAIINLNNKTIKTISIPYEGQYIKWHGDTILGKLGTENLDSLIIVTDTSGDIVKYDDIKYFNMNENGDYIIMTYKDYSYYKIQFDFFNNNNELIDSFIIDEKGKLE